MTKFSRTLFFSIAFLFISIFSSCANLPSEESTNQCEPVIPTGSDENGQYTEDDFVDDFFQFDYEYVNTYIQIGLAEDEMEYIQEITGHNRVIIGVDIQGEQRIMIPDDYGVRFFLFSKPALSRCDFYEIYGVAEYYSPTNELLGIQGIAFEDSFDAFPRFPDDFNATHVRVLVKGHLRGEFITDTERIGAYFDVPIETFLDSN